jgi:hypothetical protein
MKMSPLSSFEYSKEKIMLTSAPQKGWAWFGYCGKPNRTEPNCFQKFIITEPNQTVCL